jgi:hypothetical protein|tara:strand:- start:110 stop:346 length:237 start_codon:yes stop_codon:yes gene_type:complete
MDSLQIVYLTSVENIHSSVYDMDGAFLGYFSGYNTKPGVNSEGSIEIIVDSGENMWVNGRAKYIFGFGFKFVEKYQIN